MGVTWPCESVSDLVYGCSEVIVTYNHSVKRKTGHSRKTDTFRTSPCVEHLSRDDPAQRTTGSRERVIVDPSHDDEGPLCTAIVRDTRWELGKQDRRDNEGDHVAEVAADEWPATT